MRRHLLYYISLAICGYANAYSETEITDTLSHVLKEVVVSESTKQKDVSSTSPLQTFSQADLLKTGATSVTDAIKKMAGVNMRDYGGAGGLKTVSVRGFGSSHTGIVLDGVQLNDAQTGQIDLSRYSLDNVSSISMAIGDNDDIFLPARQASAAATVNIASFAPAAKPSIYVKTRIGSFGLINPAIKLGLPFSKQVFANAIGEYTHADNNYPFKLHNGQLVTTEKRNNSKLNSGKGEANISWKPSDRTSLSTKIYYYDCDRRLPGPVIYYNNVSHERLKERNVFWQALLQTRLSKRLSLKSLAKFNYASSMYHDENGKYPGGALDQNYWQREYYASAALLCHISEHWMADYSADYFYNSLNSNLLSDTRPYRHSVLQSLTAKFKTTQITAVARLLYSAHINGAKTGDKAKDESRLSPSVSLSYKPLSDYDWHLRASYKEIFRMPTFSEAFFDHYGSKNLLPENTRQINLGSTLSVKPNSCLSDVSVTIDGFFNRIDDMIVAVPYNMFVWTMTNLGKANILGLDATLEATISLPHSQNITVMGNYSLQRAMPRTSRNSSEWNKQVAYIPKHTCNASLTYESKWANLSLNLSGVSERYTTNSNLPATKIEGYVELGATLWREFKIKHIQVALRLDALNILDKQYCIIARYPMPGRQFQGTISFTY